MWTLEWSHHQTLDHEKQSCFWSKAATSIPVKITSKGCDCHSSCMFLWGCGFFFIRYSRAIPLHRPHRSWETNIRSIFSFVLWFLPLERLLLSILFLVCFAHSSSAFCPSSVYLYLFSLVLFRFNVWSIDFVHCSSSHEFNKKWQLT